MNTQEQSSQVSFEEAPLLALLKQAPHEMDQTSLERQIEFLRSARINSHVLTEKIKKETAPKSPKANKKLKADLVDDSSSSNLNINDLL
jgi:hypothetical protein